MNGYWDQQIFQPPNLFGRVYKWEENPVDGTVSVDLVAGWSFEDGMHILKKTFKDAKEASIAIIHTHKCDCSICMDFISRKVIRDIQFGLNNNYATDLAKFEAFLDYFGIGYEVKPHEVRELSIGPESTNKKIDVTTIEIRAHEHARTGGYTGFENEIVFDLKTGKLIVINIWE